MIALLVADRRWPRIIGAVGTGREIGLRQAMLLSVAVLVCVLALPTIAWAGETAPGSTETLKLEAPNERAVGVPMTLTVEGTADGLHHLFVYGEADRQEGCEAWPYQEQAQKGVVTLTSAEGEPLGEGHFSKIFVVAPAGEWYGVCAYLDAAASGNPDVFEYGCYQMPAHIVHFPEVPNVINCYMSYEPWWAVVAAGEWAKKLVEEREAEAKHRAEAEQAQRRAVEEGERHALRPATVTKVCRVPALRRHTLAGARRLLREADCRLGRVTTHHGHGKLVVERQSPKRGKTLAHGSAVSIVLGPSSR